MNYYRDRDPLTERTARTLRETTRDPYDFWEGPMPVQRPQRYKPRPIPTQPSLWARFVRAVIAFWRFT